MKFEIAKEKLGMIGAVIGAIGCVGGIVTAVTTASKAKKEVEELKDAMEQQTKDLNRLFNTFDETVSSLADRAEVTIPEEIVSMAINDAATKAATKAANAAVKEVRDDMKQVVDDKVTELVNNIEPAAKSEVRRVLTKKVNNINVYNLKEEIKKEVKTDIIDQLKTEVLDKAKTEVDLITSSFANQVNQQAEFIKAMNAKMNAS